MSFIPTDICYVLIHTLMDFDQTIYLIWDEKLNPESLHGAIENGNMDAAQSELLKRIHQTGRDNSNESVTTLCESKPFLLPIAAKITTSFGIY